jgi:hypothetical protein
MRDKSDEDDSQTTKLGATEQRGFTFALEQQGA